MSEAIHRADAHDLNNDEIGATRSFWFEVPKEVTAAHFPFNGEVIEIDSESSINDAFQTLVHGNILSAPVWNKKTESYLGFIDIGDLMALTYGMDLVVAAVPEAAKVTSPESNTSVGTLFDDFDSAFSKWHPVKEDTPFLEVLKILSGPARRVPVLSNETGRVTKIISQSTVVSEVYKAIKAAKDIPNEFKLTPAETGIGLKKVFCVGEDDPIKNAFLMMIENNISAVAVLDDDKKVLSCVSTKDLRLFPRLDSASFQGKSLMSKTAREYVSMARLASEKLGKSHATVACVGLNTPLQTVVGKLAETKMHRIFIVDESHNVAGVISVSDVVKLLFDEAVQVSR